MPGDGDVGTRLVGDESITPVELDGRRDVFAFAIERHAGPLVLAWKHGDALAGEEAAPTVVDWPWPHDTAVTADALGAPQPVEVRAGRARLTLSAAPAFLAAGPR